MNELPPSLTPLEMATAELLEASGYLLRRLRLESNSSALTWGQLTALAHLAKNGAMTTAELARAESVKPQSMGATLVPLEHEGLIERKPHPSDGRQSLFDLTRKGLEMRQRNTLLKREWLSEAMGAFDASEQRALVTAAALVKRMAGL